MAVVPGLEYEETLSSVRTSSSRLQVALHFNPSLRQPSSSSPSASSLSSDTFIFSQVVRTAPNKDWTLKDNGIVIGAAYVLDVSPLLRYAVAKATNALRGPARHLTRFPQMSAVGALEVGKDTKKVHCDGNGRSSEGMSYNAGRLETRHAFG